MEATLPKGYLPLVDYGILADACVTDGQRDALRRLQADRGRRGHACEQGRRMLVKMGLESTAMVSRLAALQKAIDGAAFALFELRDDEASMAARDALTESFGS